MKRWILSGALFLGLLSAGGPIAFAQSQVPQNPSSSRVNAPSPAYREQMAAIHEKMAACLRSNKPLSECRAEMRNNCRKMMGANCFMGGQAGGRANRGMMGPGMGPMGAPGRAQSAP